MDAKAFPACMLEMSSDRFKAFGAIAYATIQLARHVPQGELSMDLLVAGTINFHLWEAACTS